MMTICDVVRVVDFSEYYEWMIDHAVARIWRVCVL